MKYSNGFNTRLTINFFDGSKRVFAPCKLAGSTSAKLEGKELSLTRVFGVNPCGLTKKETLNGINSVWEEEA